MFERFIKGNLWNPISDLIFNKAQFELLLNENIKNESS